MVKKGLVAVLLFGCLVGALGVGAFVGFNTALASAAEQRLYQKVILKAAYAVERYESIGDLPPAFRAKWSDRVKEFAGNRKIGVYIGDGSNATPFLPLQLEKMGFEVVRFDMQHLARIKECSELVFPGGSYSVDFSKDAAAAIQEYVAAGGGYLGVCLGCLASKRLGLISGDIPVCPVTGLISCEINREFFKESKKELNFLHMNGRILSGAGLDPLVWWGDHVMAGTKTFGKGRILLFSSHPEGGKIEYGHRYVLTEGTTLGTMDLLLQAVFYVARSPAERQ